MLVRQSKNTFIRFYDGKAYITNQLTRYDRYYNETGADFLKEISRQERYVDDIISSLKTLYGDSVNLKKLSDDFLSFVMDLERNYFLVTGNSVQECDSKDIDFSYSLGNTRCLERNYNEHQGDMFKISKHLCDVAFLTKRIHEEYEQRGML